MRNRSADGTLNRLCSKVKKFQGERNPSYLSQNSRLWKFRGVCVSASVSTMAASFDLVDGDGSSADTFLTQIGGSTSIIDEPSVAKTDTFTKEVMMSMDKKKVNALKREFEKRDAQGLTLTEFVLVMKKVLGKVGAPQQILKQLQSDCCRFTNEFLPSTYRATETKRSKNRRVKIRI